MNLNRPHSSTLNRYAHVRSHSSFSSYSHLNGGDEHINFTSSYASFQQQHDRFSNSQQLNSHSNNINGNSILNQQIPSFSSLSSAQQYNNYSSPSPSPSSNNNNFYNNSNNNGTLVRPMTASYFGKSNNSSNNASTGGTPQPSLNTNSDNVQYGPNLARRKSISSQGHNIRRSQTPQPPPSIIYQPATFHLHPSQQSTMSITNIPSHSKAIDNMSLNNSSPILNISPITENVIVRVPTARRKVEKTGSKRISPKAQSSPAKGDRNVQESTSPSSPLSNSATNFSNTFLNGSTNRPSSASVNRRDRPLKPNSSSGNLLLNRPRSSTPTLKKSTSLSKLPPRELNNRNLTKSSSSFSLTNTPSMLNTQKKTPKLSQIINSTNPSNKVAQTIKKETPTPTNKVPKLLKSLVELKAQQAKIEILTLEDYMLESPSRTIIKVLEEIPPPKHKLLAILMDINIRYNTNVTNTRHPNYEFYITDREVYTALKERQAYLVETRYGKLLSPIDECGIQFEGAYFGRYSFVFNLDTNYFGYHSWTLILRAYLDGDSTTLCVFGEKYCWFTVDINNVKMNNQEFQRTIGGMLLNEWNEIFISLNMLQQPGEHSHGRKILVWANGVNTVIPIDPETKLKIKPGENKTLNFVNMLNGRAFRGALSSVVLLNKASESMEDLVRSGKSFLKNHQKPTEKPSLIMLSNNSQSPKHNHFQDEEDEELVFA